MYMDRLLRLGHPICTLGWLLFTLDENFFHDPPRIDSINKKILSPKFKLDRITGKHAFEPLNIKISNLINQRPYMTWRITTSLNFEFQGSSITRNCFTVLLFCDDFQFVISVICVFLVNVYVEAYFCEPSATKVQYLDFTVLYKIFQISNSRSFFFEQN